MITAEKEHPPHYLHAPAGIFLKEKRNISNPLLTIGRTRCILTAIFVE